MMKLLSSFCLSLLFFTCFGQTPADTLYKTWHLKGGYILQIKSSGDSNEVVLTKGKQSSVLDEAEKSLGLDVLGYVYADFDSTYIMMTHAGAEPVQFELIDKAQASTIIYGQSPFYNDTVNHLMMFKGLYGQGRGNLVLYNFKTNRAEYFPAPLNTPCFYYYCWRVVSLTDKEVKVAYENMKHETEIKTYNRK